MFANKISKEKSDTKSDHTNKLKRNDKESLQVMDNRPQTAVQQKMQEFVNNSIKSKQVAKLQALANYYPAETLKSIPVKNKFTALDHSLKQENGTHSSAPIQMVKINVDGMDFETNGEYYENLLRLRGRVNAEDSEKLELAIRTAYAIGLRAPVTASSSSAAASDSSMRRRRGNDAEQTQPQITDGPVPAAPHNFATSHGPFSHGAGAWTSTGAAILSGGPDAAALRNSSADTMNMASRTVSDFRRGHLKDASISATQALLSAGQTALSTPASHVLNHAAGAMVGSPIPLPAADALWYPANWAKDGLESLRDPKEKTQ